MTMPYKQFMGYLYAAKAQKIQSHKMLINAMRIAQADSKDLTKYLAEMDEWSSYMEDY